MNQLFLHVNFVADENLSDAAALAASAGYDGIEPVAPRGPSAGPDPVEWPDDDFIARGLRDIVTVCQPYGLSTASLYGGGLWVLRDEDQPARAEGEVDFFSRLLPLAAEIAGVEGAYRESGRPFDCPGRRLW